MHIYTYILFKTGNMDVQVFIEAFEAKRKSGALKSTT